MPQPSSHQVRVSTAHPTTPDRRRSGVVTTVSTSRCRTWQSKVSTGEATIIDIIVSFRRDCIYQKMTARSVKASLTESFSIRRQRHRVRGLIGCSIEAAVSSPGREPSRIDVRAQARRLTLRGTGCSDRQDEGRSNSPAERPRVQRVRRGQRRTHRPGVTGSP